MVRLGAPTGRSERESGAVTISQTMTSDEQDGGDLDRPLDHADARKRRLRRRVRLAVRLRCRSTSSPTRIALLTDA